MLWKSLNKDEANRIMSSWNGQSIVSCDDEFIELRTDLVNSKTDSLEELRITEKDINKTTYAYDLAFGLRLYEVLSDKYCFHLKNASDDGVWRYLSINVIPDLVFERWGESPARFWKESRRIWIKTLWWYIHLSWQGDRLRTYEILKDNTTDEIAQLVERSGASGYRVATYRTIMEYYGRVDKKQKKRNSQLFRRVMKLNIARTKVIEPGLVIGGEKMYVKELFDYFETKN